MAHPCHEQPPFLETTPPPAALGSLGLSKLACPRMSEVYIVDDDRAVLDGLGQWLTTEGLAVRAHESARKFLETIQPTDTGCVLTDLRMPDITGLDLLATLKARVPFLPVIIITGHGDVPLAVEAMKQGAYDFFETPFDDDALLASIRAALARGDDARWADAETQMNGARFATLSKREKEVLTYLLDGQPNKIVAHRLGISARTVEVHRANLMAKMHATSLADLVKMAVSCENPTFNDQTGRRPQNLRGEYSGPCGS